MTLLMIRIPGTGASRPHCPVPSILLTDRHADAPIHRGVRPNSIAPSASLSHNLLSIVSGRRLNSVSNSRRAIDVSAPVLRSYRVRALAAVPTAKAAVWRAQMLVWRAPRSHQRMGTRRWLARCVPTAGAAVRAHGSICNGLDRGRGLLSREAFAGLCARKLALQYLVEQPLELHTLLFSLGTENRKNLRVQVNGERENRPFPVELPTLAVREIVLVLHLVFVSHDARLPD